MKSKRDKELDSICTLIHSKNMYIKEHKIMWSISSESSKALRFLSFHNIQNRHKGATFQVFFLFFPTKAPRQLTKASLIENGITHWTSKIAKIRCHNMLGLGQWMRIWFDSSWPLKNDIFLEGSNPSFLANLELEFFSKKLPKQWN